MKKYEKNKFKNIVYLWKNESRVFLGENFDEKSHLYVKRERTCCSYKKEPVSVLVIYYDHNSIMIIQPIFIKFNKAFSLKYSWFYFIIITIYISNLLILLFTII